MQRRIIILPAILIAFILCVYCIVNAAFDIPKEDFTGQPTYKVIKIIDGNTVELLMNGKGTKVKLIGVNTPQPLPHRREATRFFTDLLKGEEVYMEQESGSTTDEVMAYLYRAPDGLFVNLEIIRQGYGSAHTASTFQHSELFDHYKEQAEKLEKGLWAPEARIVYITKKGLKYHREGCPHLKFREIYQVTVRAAKNCCKDPCGSCVPPQ